jgi:hypothetical protein
MLTVQKSVKAKVLTGEEDMNITRACHDRRDWMHPERAIT